MPQRSTEDALYTLVERNIIIMVSLDIESAFNSAWNDAGKNIRRLVGS